MTAGSWTSWRLVAKCDRAIKIPHSWENPSTLEAGSESEEQWTRWMQRIRGQKAMLCGLPEVTFHSFARASQWRGNKRVLHKLSLAEGSTLFTAQWFFQSMVLPKSHRNWIPAGEYVELVSMWNSAYCRDLWLAKVCSCSGAREQDGWNGWDVISQAILLISVLAQQPLCYGGPDSACRQCLWSHLAVRPVSVAACFGMCIKSWEWGDFTAWNAGRGVNIKQRPCKGVEDVGILNLFFFSFQDAGGKKRVKVRKLDHKNQIN